MKISQELLDEIVAHALEDPGNEVCGLVAVTAERRARRHRACYRAHNIHASPMKFEIDPKELLRLHNAIEDDGWELGAIYHSHVRSPPYPSQTDVNFAATWPGRGVDHRRPRRRRARGALLPDRRTACVRRCRSPQRGDVSEKPLVCPACGRTHARSERFCASAGCRWSSCPAASSEASERQQRARKIKPQYTEGALVKVARAANQPEAELIEGLLLEEGIPSMQRRARRLDVPDFLAAGPRDMLVPESARRGGARSARTAARDDRAAE